MPKSGGMPARNGQSSSAEVVRMSKPTAAHRPGAAPSQPIPLRALRIASIEGRKPVLDTRRRTPAGTRRLHRTRMDRASCPERSSDIHRASDLDRRDHLLVIREISEIGRVFSCPPVEPVAAPSLLRPRLRGRRHGLRQIRPTYMVGRSHQDRGRGIRSSIPAASPPAPASLAASNHSSLVGSFAAVSANCRRHAFKFRSAPKIIDSCAVGPWMALLAAWAEMACIIIRVGPER